MKFLSLRHDDATLPDAAHMTAASSALATYRICFPAHGERLPKTVEFEAASMSDVLRLIEREGRLGFFDISRDGRPIYRVERFARQGWHLAPVI